MKILTLVLSLLLALPAAADEAAQFAAIKRLGDLNGIALHCRALVETRRMKMALIRNLPQRRQLGELFDHQSHESFMAFIQRKDRCPSMAELSNQVDAAITQLERVYAPENQAQ
ncbi:MAG: hypothetical protein HQL47_09915 [Gammaproteobacteria bacterium]|nr:hypothetical protein [Gammaproteobacteria bacterium]